MVKPQLDHFLVLQSRATPPSLSFLTCIIGQVIVPPSRLVAGINWDKSRVGRSVLPGTPDALAVIVVSFHDEMCCSSSFLEAGYLSCEPRGNNLQSQWIVMTTKREDTSENAV